MKDIDKENSFLEVDEKVLENAVEEALISEEEDNMNITKNHRMSPGEKLYNALYETPDENITCDICGDSLSFEHMYKLDGKLKLSFENGPGLPEIVQYLLGSEISPDEEGTVTMNIENICDTCFLKLVMMFNTTVLARHEQVNKMKEQKAKPTLEEFMKTVEDSVDEDK